MTKTSLTLALSLLLLLAAAAFAVQITGQVVDEDGAPQSEVKVELSGDHLYSAWTDDDGSFSIASVAEGSYEVRVTGSGQSTFEVRVDGRGMHPSRLVVDW